MRMDEGWACSSPAVARSTLECGIAGHGIGTVDFFEMEVGESGNQARNVFPPAVWTSTGTEIAYPLSSTQKITGSFPSATAFMASQNSPSLEVPSPRENISDFIALEKLTFLN